MITTYFSTILRSLREGFFQLLSKLNIFESIERELQQTQKNCTELHWYACHECPSDVVLKLVIFEKAFYEYHVSGSDQTPADAMEVVDKFNRKYKIGMWKRDVDCEYVAKCLRETNLFDSAITDPEILKHYSKHIKTVEAYRSGLFDKYPCFYSFKDYTYIYNSSEPEKGVILNF